MEPEETAAGAGSGARRARVTGRRPRAVLVRLSEEEHRELAVRAAGLGVSIPRLLVESVRAGTAGETVTERREAVRELVTVRRLLANLANNVNQLAKAANSGVNLSPAEVDAELGYLRKLGERILTVVEELMPR